MNMSNEGDACLKIDDLRNVSHVDASATDSISSTFFIAKSYLIGDTKGVFQLVGRSGFDSSYCTHCHCRSKAWKEMCSLRTGAYDECCVKAEDWSIEEINDAALVQMQETAAGRKFTSVGVRGCSLISFLPITRTLPPILHLLLGVGNDVFSIFKDFIVERVEKASPEEKDARNMTFLAEIKHEDAALLCSDSKVLVQTLVQERMLVNARLKERGLDRGAKDALREEVEIIKCKIAEKSKLRDDLEKTLKDLKTDYEKRKGIEAVARKNDKDASKHLLMNHIECVMLKRHRISRSCYHGGDLQGNDVRRLMARGIVVFEEIKACLLIHKPDNVHQEEVELYCVNYGRLCSLMDNMFSALHAKRGTIADEKIETLKEDLNLVRLKWKVSFILLNSTCI